MKHPIDTLLDVIIVAAAAFILAASLLNVF